MHILARCCLQEYAFRHYVCGQPKPLTELLKDNTYGFPKRFHEVWCLEPDCDKRQEHQASMSFLKGAHVFWAKHSDWQRKKEHCPDGFAQNLFRLLEEAIKDFAAANPTLPGALVEMLSFSDTHLHRMANALRKCVLYLESLSDLSFAADREEYTVFEVFYALHNLRRQWLLKKRRMIIAGDHDVEQPGPAIPARGSDPVSKCIFFLLTTCWVRNNSRVLTFPTLR